MQTESGVCKTLVHIRSVAHVLPQYLYQCDVKNRVSRAYKQPLLSIPFVYVSDLFNEYLEQRSKDNKHTTPQLQSLMYRILLASVVSRAPCRQAMHSFSYVCSLTAIPTKRWADAFESSARFPTQLHVTNTPPLFVSFFFIFQLYTDNSAILDVTVPYQITPTFLSILSVLDVLVFLKLTQSGYIFKFYTCSVRDISQVCPDTRRANLRKCDAKRENTAFSYRVMIHRARQSKTTMDLTGHHTLKLLSNLVFYVCVKLLEVINQL